MACRDQLAKAKVEIQKLNEKIQGAQISTSMEEGKKINRSTLEAYIGIFIGIAQGVWPMSWLFRVGLFAVLCIIVADLSWRSPATYKWHKRWKTILSCCIVTVFIWLGWINVSRQLMQEEFPADVEYMLKWGLAGPTGQQFQIAYGDPPKTNIPIKADIEIDGERLFRHADKYKVVVICSRYDGVHDFKDLSDLLKSQAFDIINGPFNILIPYTNHFINQIGTGKGLTTYVLLLIPKNLTPDDFTTIRDATNKGAVILEFRSGPPE